MKSEATMTSRNRKLPRVRMFRAHSSECWAKRKPGGCWYIRDYSVHYLDAVGTRRGSWHRWIELRCNCTQCDAVVLVNENDLTDLVSAALAKPKPKARGRK